MTPTNESIGRYTKRPVTVEAMQLIANPSDQYVEDMHAFLSGCDWSSDQDGIDIETLEGTMHASDGDWIIKGIKGEFYPCKPDIFAETYEPARELDRQAPGEWVMVPREATAEMLAEFCKLEPGDVTEFQYYGGLTGYDHYTTEEGGKRAWETMLAAAPQPPAQEQGEVHLDLLRRMEEANHRLIGAASDHRAIADGIDAIRTLTRAAGSEDARGVTWPATLKEQGSYREVIQETLKWNGVPCFVTGRVWTHNNNWPLIDAAIASQAKGGGGERSER